MTIRVFAFGYTARVSAAVGAVVFALSFGLSVQSAHSADSAATKSGAVAVSKAKSPQVVDTATIISGHPNGTYLPIAYDMATVVETSGVPIRVLPILGKGSYQNIRDLLFQKGVDIGLTQTNVLSHLKRSGELGKDINKHIAYIAKLYNEEIHILAGPGIDTIKDLNGKRVHFGAEGSGSHFTGQQLLRSLGVTPVAVKGCQTEAYLKLKAGEIDAMVVVDGKPSAALKRFVPAPGIKVLPIAYDPALHSDFLPAKLDDKTYPNLISSGHSIDTVAVGAVLVVYNWPEKNPNAARISQFVMALFANFESLKDQSRHPKWRETSLAATVEGYPRYKPARDWVDRVGQAIKKAAHKEPASSLQETQEQPKRDARAKTKTSATAKLSALSH